MVTDWGPSNGILIDAVYSSIMVTPTTLFYGSGLQVHTDMQTTLLTVKSGESQKLRIMAGGLQVPKVLEEMCMWSPKVGVKA